MPLSLPSAAVQCRSASRGCSSPGARRAPPTAALTWHEESAAEDSFDSFFQPLKVDRALQARSHAGGAAAVSATAASSLPPPPPSRLPAQQACMSSPNKEARPPRLGRAVSWRSRAGVSHTHARGAPPLSLRPSLPPLAARRRGGFAGTLSPGARPRRAFAVLLPLAAGVISKLTWRVSPLSRPTRLARWAQPRRARARAHVPQNPRPLFPPPRRPSPAHPISPAERPSRPAPLPRPPQECFAAWGVAPPAPTSHSFVNDLVRGHHPSSRHG